MPPIPFVRWLLSLAPVRLWGLILGGPPMLAFCSWVVWIVWKGDWPASAAAQRLTILGYGLYIALAIVAVIIIALAAVKVKGKSLVGEFEVDGDEHDDVPPSTTTVQVKTEVK